jgi:molybdenum cofactor cytidylyltransferase
VTTATAAVVLAAGAGSRFAGDVPKLIARWRDRPLVWWAVTHAQEASIGPVWVVTGAADLAGALPGGVALVPNPRWAAGQSTSLQAAVAEGRRARMDALVVGLGDQPAISPEAWRAVAGAPAPIAVATYQGRRRNPVRLAQSVWDLLPAEGDEGARVTIREHPQLVTEVACEGNPTDIDTWEDLYRWS